VSDITTNIVIGYCRVSTNDQAVEGHSLESQRARIERWAQERGYQVAAIYVDEGISGKRADNRPQLQQALAQVCRDKGMLVFYSLSRLARSVIDAATIAERLRKNGAGMASLTEPVDTSNAAGRFIYSILAAMAEFERETICERTRGVLGYMKSAGKVVGTVPYGRIRNGDDLVECPDEQEVIVRMRTMRAAGNGYRLVARTLNNDGVKAKSGGEWSPQAVKSVSERCEVTHAS
jgi:site-specific DNA recombinase